MKKKKRALTLIEVFIYFALCSSIVAILLISLRNNSKISFKLDRAKTDIMQRERVQQRLGSIFYSLSSLQQDPSQPRENPITLKTIEGRSQLHFYFNNSIDPEPDFCHQVKGVLTCSQEGNINLTVKCIENDKERKEILLSGVQKLEFIFLFQDSLGTFIERTDLKHNDPLNLRAIKLLTNKNMLNELTFIFWLPFEMTPIYYPHAV